VPTALLLEDYQSNRQLLSGLLSSVGCEVLEATNGMDAIETFNDHSAIDLLVADVSVPGISGTEVAVKVRKVRSDLPVLFISGTPISGWRLCDRENLKRLSTHLVDFLEKPFHISTFLDKVRQMLLYRSASR
jgi:CheY-like chemotaxis protein